MDNTHSIEQLQQPENVLLTTSQDEWRYSCVFIVNFELISHVVLFFPLLTLNKWTSAESFLKNWLKLSRLVFKSVLKGNFLSFSKQLYLRT